LQLQNLRIYLRNMCNNGTNISFTIKKLLYSLFSQMAAPSNCLDNQPQQDAQQLMLLHLKARHVVARCAARHFERRQQLGIHRPNAGVWDVLHNELYYALSAANKEPEFGTALLADSPMSRQGITATILLASLYGAVNSQLELAKHHHGRTDNIAEFQRLLDLLAPLVASLKPTQEARAYTASQSALYQQQ
jgi:hypothetical protein